MAITLDGTNGITNDSGYTGDGVSFADSTPANTLVTTSGGNVGIGTSSPTQRVQIGNPSDANQGMLLYFPDADNAAIYTTRFSTGSLQSLQVGAQNTLKFLTNATERARFDSSGNLLVGTTSTNVYLNSTANNGGISMMKDAAGMRLDVARDNSCYTANRPSTNGQVIDFRRSGSNVGNISVTTTTTSYNTSSDYRLKHDIAPMIGALAKVAALKPVTYKWNADNSLSQGFIAHELQEVVPECVTGEKDAVDAEGKPVYQGIDTSFLVATLTAAIQELKAEVDSLKAQINGANV